MGPVVFLLFISLLLPAHDVTEGNVDTSLDTIRSCSLLQFRIHLVLLPSESEIRAFEWSGNERDNWPGIEVVVANDSDAISLNLSLSEVKAAHSLRQHSLRLDSHAKHTSILVCSISVCGLPYLFDVLNSRERNHGQGVTIHPIFRLDLPLVP